MRIIINREIFEISKYISGYHLKCLISKKFNLNPNKIRLYSNSKEINNNKSIDFLKDNSKIDLFEEKLKGGKFTIYGFFIAIILIIIYSFLMFSGFMNIISYIYSSGLVFIGNYLKKGLEILLGKDNLFYKFLIFFSSIILIVVRSFALFLTVFALTAYLTINIFNLRTDDTCIAYKNNYYLSLWISIIYVVIYIFFNLFNIIIDLLSNISQSTMIIGPLIKFINNTIKKGWDSIKFFPVYILPFVGNGIRGYHQAVDISMLYFTMAKVSLNEFKNFITNSKDFDEFERLIDKPEIKRFINDNQLNTAIEYLRFNYMDNKEKENYIRITGFSQKDIITVRFIYWFLNNIIILLQSFFWIFKLSCGTTDTSQLELMKENIIKNFKEMDKNKNINTNNLNKDLKLQIDYLENRIKNINDNDGLDQDCVANILKSSNAAGGFSFFFYIIILIILLIFLPFK
jgi:hypothetical protein